MDIERVEGDSWIPHNETNELLRNALPGVFADGAVNADLLSRLVNAPAVGGEERYGLNWAGKSACFEEIARGTKATLGPDVSASINFDTTKNLFIEGENLEVLKLLQRSYYGKVKMIYIDPPYNTGKDFVYKDRFGETTEKYEAKTGDKDSGGAMVKGLMRNSRDSGRYHSNWLNMMHPRLYLARNLLQKNGVMFVSIDDNEVHNLRLLMDEIFGEENFVAQIIWEKKYTSSNNVKGVSYTHEYVLCYTKNIDEITSAIGRFKYSEEARARFSNPDNDPRGDWSDMSYHGPKSPTERPNLNYPIIHPVTGDEIWPKEKSWAYERKVHETHVSENRLWWGKNGTYQEPRVKVFLSEIQGGIIPKSLWNYEEFGTTAEGRADLRELFGVNDDGTLFDNPKPVRLLRKMIELTTSNDDMVLDFFAGSGTTAQAVMEQSIDDKFTRQYICVQMPEQTPEEGQAWNAGYKSISDISLARIQKSAEAYALQYPNYEGDLGVRVLRLQGSNFPVWYDRVYTSGEEFAAATRDIFARSSQSEDVLAKAYEIMLKLGVPLSAKVTVDGQIARVSYSEGMQVYVLSDTPVDIAPLLAEKPEIVVATDASFASDADKANIVLRANKEGIKLLSL